MDDSETSYIMNLVNTIAKAEDEIHVAIKQLAEKGVESSIEAVFEIKEINGRQIKLPYLISRFRYNTSIIR